VFHMPFAEERDLMRKCFGLSIRARFTNAYREKGIPSLGLLMHNIRGSELTNNTGAPLGWVFRTEWERRMELDWN
jgi:hypothetical protein